MTRNIYALLLLTCCMLSTRRSLASDTTRVLFIGNSFVYVNMVPEIVKGIAAAGNIQMEYRMHAPGGATIGDIEQGTFAHMENAAVFQLIRQGGWDYVVVQDNQGRFLYDRGVFRPQSRTIEGHKRIMDSTHHYNPCATMVWFSGWAFKDGAPPYGNTGIELIDRIDANYKFMNDSLDQLIAPIGAAWKRSAIASPEIDLWDTDEAHASLNGSYLTAAVLFCTMFKRDPEHMSFNSSLTAARAKAFRELAYQTFVDSFTNDNEEMFTLPLSYATGSLTAGTGYATYVYFKDGVQIAANSNNSFAVTPDGCYQVKAKSAAGCWRFSKELCLSPTAIPGLQEEKNPFVIYPNPAHDHVTVSGNSDGKPLSIAIYDLMGKLMYQGTTKQPEYQVDISGLARGSYFICLQSSSRTWKTPLVIR